LSTSGVSRMILIADRVNTRKQRELTMSCCTFDQISQAIHDGGGEIDGRTTKFIEVLVGEDEREVISYSHILDRLREIFESLIDLF
jgi:hypothetical protein